MFSALRQGSVVYILEKNNGLTCTTGQVISASSPQFTNSSFPNMQNLAGVINIKVDVGNGTRDFGNLPANGNIEHYDNGKTIVSESREAIVNEVEIIIQNANNIIENIDNTKKLKADGEEILKNLNPIYAKEKAREEEIVELRDHIKGVDNKLDKLIAALSKSGVQ